MYFIQNNIIYITKKIIGVCNFLKHNSICYILNLNLLFLEAFHTNLITYNLKKMVKNLIL